jgi:AcrR family transcriptional regulator
MFAEEDNVREKAVDSAGREAGNGAEDRRRRRHARTQADILRAAREIMLESGVNGVTVREVARRSDFSPAALYKYFDGRDEIVRALTMEAFVRLQGAIAAVPQSLRPDRRLLALGESYLRFAKENPADLHMIIVSTRSAPLDPEELEIGLAVASTLRDVLQEGIRQGLFRPLTPKQLAATAFGLWSLVHGMATLTGANLALVKDQISEDPRRAMQIFIDGLRVPSAGA